MNANTTRGLLEISKYSNRRYYDRTRSRHVTLEEIRDLVREGYGVQITDSKTGEDLTQRILTQIILELDAGKLGLFPVALLQQIIRANEQLLTGFWEAYFQRGMSLFEETRQQWAKSLQGLPGWPGMGAGLPGWAGAEAAPAKEAEPAAGSAGGNEPGGDPRLEEMLRRMEAMQARLDALAGTGGKPAPGKRAQSKRG